MYKNTNMAISVHTAYLSVSQYRGGGSELYYYLIQRYTHCHQEDCPRVQRPGILRDRH